ncbi:S-acyltransferase 3 [Micractinium conductrix]|uniref:S-acyltransferase 3 n=1 Tax=Micractinium conductrix TaxID=554055 RepID=A0A2P6VGH4_9CHLO|nr:S-acyltransferase 3 [Micractinium conductrix]|eukprot:PSC73199.1 S-acyltransferase 3 [Micractinium conductrix]
MVVSSRVLNAKSERYYKAGLGKKKQPGFWQGIRKQLAAHPIVVALIFFIMVFSGVASFFMYLPAERHRFNFGGLYNDDAGSA